MGITILEARGKVIDTVEKSASHGDVLYIDFEDRTQLVVWGFHEPDKLQVVLWNPNSGEVISDQRNAICKEYTRRVYQRLENRNPPVVMDTPFKTYHRPLFIPVYCTYVD